MAFIKFYGAAGEVTGSNHIFEGEHIKIMIDCGFFQGVKTCDDKNIKPFPYDPTTIDVLFVTHAHLDHIGRIPKLFNEGFKGKIYSTQPTRDIAQLMLEDATKVIDREARADNHEPLYGIDALEHTFKNWEVTPYNKEIILKDDFRVCLRDAGHILGSAMIEITHHGKKVVFSGDLGSTSLLLPKTELLSGVDYLIMEAVYGDKTHDDFSNRNELLKEVIKDTIAHGGVLMIPAFSIERTQDILFELNKMVEHRMIPQIPIFVDSPLGIKVTKIFEKSTSYFNEDTQGIINGGDDIFKFPKLQFTERSKDSIAIKDVKAPKIIIAGSGMSNGGRILHHEKNYLSDPKNTLLIVGYQAVGTMGRALQQGIKNVKIFYEHVPVRAKIVTIQGYSAHKDVDELINFVEGMSTTLKKICIVHAEPGPALFFSQRVHDYFNISTVIPEVGDVVEIVDM